MSASRDPLLEPTDILEVKYSIPHKTRLGYAATRLGMFAYNAGVTAYDIYKNTDQGKHWPLYISHWSITLNSMHQLLELLPIPRFLKKKAVTEEEFNAIKEKHAILRDIALVLSLAVASYYWLFEYDKDNDAPPWPHLLIHGGPFLSYATDVLTNKLSFGPQKLTDLRWLGPGALTGFYVAFNAIYVAAGGKNEDGENFIYDDMDWIESPLSSSIKGTSGLLITFVLPLVPLATKSILAKCSSRTQVESKPLDDDIQGDNSHELRKALDDAIAIEESAKVEQPTDEDLFEQPVKRVSWCEKIMMCFSLFGSKKLTKNTPQDHEDLTDTPIIPEPHSPTSPPNSPRQ